MNDTQHQTFEAEPFGALVAALIDCNAVPRGIMAATLQQLAERLVAKARSAMEKDGMLYPAEMFDRARALNEMAAGLSAREELRP